MTSQLVREVSPAEMENPQSEIGFLVSRGGVIRPARRPPGWRAPGPPPPQTPPDTSCFPRSGEDLCWLTGDWRILQRLDGHRWSLDDLVTAWVAADEWRGCTPARIADLGCGIGAVLLMMAWRFPGAKLVGVEAQELSVDLARRSLRWNGAADRCEVRLGDLRDASILPEAGCFDLVTGTPPYLRRGTAVESARVQVAPCHFEHRGGIEDYCRAAARLLSSDGVFVFCAGTMQRDRVAAAVEAANLAIHRTLDVIPRAGKAPLFAVYATHRAGVMFPRITEEPLVVRDRGGRRTVPFRNLRDTMGMPP